MRQASAFQEKRINYNPPLPILPMDLAFLKPEHGEVADCPSSLKSLFPKTCGRPVITFSTGSSASGKKMRLGVVLSGGQAAGGHNVITGLFDAIKTLHSGSALIGFLDGPSGIIDHKCIELTARSIHSYRNQGGFDMIGAGRTKIETPEQFAKAADTCKKLNLDGLLIIGGDDSNTNAALLAEYFLANGCKTIVIGVPKTIDGDLKNKFVEASFGFDTASKTYSNIIGNIARDSLSSKKYYFFIKLMGRSASHIALECALQTHANLTFISEEIAEKKLTLQQITGQICDIIVKRAEQNKNYGVILIPEGLIEFIPEFKTLISELNKLMAEKAFKNADEARSILAQLTKTSLDCFNAIPEEIQKQLLLDRDPHGNVQVSKIETERLLIATAAQELERRQKQGKYKGKFSAQPLFCGYEGRSCHPSNFDAKYCYALGQAAALLFTHGLTGYMATISNLQHGVERWQPRGVPLTSMMTIEERKGQKKPVIEKALVQLNGPVFAKFKAERDSWGIDDKYLFPGPIQFDGDPEITDKTTITLQIEQMAKAHKGHEKVMCAKY